jgi:quinol monooxygenase YgiN
MIRHLVLWKLAAESREEKDIVIDELQARFAALVPQIEGTERLDIRADLGSTEGNWDVVLDSDYRDEAALDFYQAHPAHQEVVQYVKSVTTARACIDFSDRAELA